MKSFTDITNLYNSIINPENTTSSENQPETNSKNIFWKIKDRIWSQWNEITRDNLKKKPVQTMLRAIWFAATWVWAAVLSYKWIKKLFWWWEDEEDDEKKEKEEKSSIRKRIGSLVLDYFEKNKK